MEPFARPLIRRRPAGPMSAGDASPAHADADAVEPDRQPFAAHAERSDGAPTLGLPQRRRRRGVSLCAPIPPLLRPLALSLVLALVLLLAGAVSPDGSFARTAVFDCFGAWTWTYVICLPTFAAHLARILVAGLARLRVRFCPPRGLALGEPAAAPPPRARVASAAEAVEGLGEMQLFGWLPVGDALLALLTWTVMGTASAVGFGTRTLPRAELSARPLPAASELVFPKAFLWGAATAAYQIEGNLTNTQWYAFEREFVRPDGSAAIENGDRCGLADDSWERFDVDLGCMTGLGLSAYRFSVEWSRVEPERGVFDSAALERYVSWATQLRAAGIEPLVTLHHFTEPLWLTAEGGLLAPSAADDFAAFVEVVAAALAPLVDVWVTINEPMVVTTLGWVTGEFPPAGQGDLGGMYRALMTMVEMHRAAHAVLKRVDTLAAPGGRGEPCEVGIAKSAVLFEPASAWHPIEALAAGAAEGWYNLWPLRQLQRAREEGRDGRAGRLRPRGTGLDYVGINHYFNQRISRWGGYGGHVPGYATSDMGWSLDPASLYETLVQYGRWAPGVPMVVTEHGVADDQAPDTRRVDFLARSLDGLRLAVVQRGLPVRGYMHWSLLDNFEWAKGFGMRFGLFGVDYETFERSWTHGGRLYKEVIDANRQA